MNKLDVQEDSDYSDDFFIGEILNNDNCTSKDWTEVINVENNLIRFKLDTGAQCNAINEKVYEVMKQSMPTLVLQECSSNLISFTGEQVKPKGRISVSVKHDQKDYHLTFFVTGKNCLLGLKACMQLDLIRRTEKAPEINLLKENDRDSLLHEFEDVFTGLGCLPHKHKIVIKDGFVPGYTPPRHFSEKLKEKVKVELQRMEEFGVCEKTDEPSIWINNMVTPHKNDGSDKIRICIDPKSLNAATIPRKHPLQTFDSISSRLSQSRFFSTADAKCGFWQIPLDDESSKLCTFQTPFGRYKMLRLPFGIVDASEVFQCTMEKLFGDIAEICIDDIFIHAPTKLEHDKKLRDFLERCRKVNLTLNPDKFKVNVESVKYLGHIISKDGIRADPSKIEAITNMPAPQCKEDVMRFLGMVQYLAKFLPLLSDVSVPLRDVIKKDVQFVMEQPQIDSFNKIKHLITSAPVLRFYDPDSPVTLQVDSSSVGVGACMLQDDRPVSYASAALTKTQQRWSQIEKECFAILFACRKFHCYLYGQNVTVVTDHKPLIPIFKKSLNSVTPRLTRILLPLQCYNIALVWKPGKDLKLADTLSRAYLTSETANSDDIDNTNVEVYQFIKELPISKQWYETFKAETLKDECLKQVVLAVENNSWHKLNKCSKELNAFYNIRHELFVEDDILFLNKRIVVPLSLRPDMLKLLHQGHFGIEKTRGRARNIVFWPGLSRDIENFIKKCSQCCEFQYSNCKEPLKKHDLILRPWAKIAMDLFQYKGIKYLIITDYYSRYFEYFNLGRSDSTAGKIISCLKDVFSRLGIPDICLLIDS